MTQSPALKNIPMPIRTPRLVIHPPHPDYAEVFYAAKVESADVLYPWMTWIKDGPGTLEQQREMFVKKQAQFITRDDLMMLAFTHDGEFVVATGLHNIDWHIPLGEIGYWCKKSAQGKGYVTEAANALARYAFGALGFRKVNLGMDTENKNSEAVAKRLNMTHEFDNAGAIDTLHPIDGPLRVRRNYCCFDTSALPPLDVSWG